MDGGGRGKPGSVLGRCIFGEVELVAPPLQRGCHWAVGCGETARSVGTGARLCHQGRSTHSGDLQSRFLQYRFLVRHILSVINIGG